MRIKIGEPVRVTSFGDHAFTKGQILTYSGFRSKPVPCFIVTDEKGVQQKIETKMIERINPAGK
jgi:hypothetical protein